MTFYASSATSPQTSPAPARRGSIGGAVLAGLGAAVAGSIVWAIIAYFTKHQFSLVAILVGSLVGFTISRIRPGSAAAAAAGALLALLGCALGTFLALIFVQVREGTALNIVLRHLNVIAHAYPRSIGALGIVFWLMAAAFASANTLGLRHDRPGHEPQFDPPPEAGEVSGQRAAARPVPGGYGAPQAPSDDGQDRDGDQPGVDWALQPVTVLGTAASTAESAAARSSGPPAPRPAGPPSSPLPAFQDGGPPSSPLPAFQDGGPPSAPMPAFRDGGPLSAPLPAFQDGGPLSGPLPAFRDSGPLSAPMPAFRDGGPLSAPLPAFQDGGPLSGPLPAFQNGGAPSAPMPAFRDGGPPAAIPDGGVTPSTRPVRARHAAGLDAAGPAPGQPVPARPAENQPGATLPSRQRPRGRHSRPQG
jgi:hypothetical protein